MSSGSRPATAMARLPATAARVAVDSCGAAMRRSRMPVRVRIHSSDVSTRRSRSALVRTRSGAYIPQPVMRTLAGRIGPAPCAQLGSTSMRACLALTSSPFSAARRDDATGDVALDLVEQLHRLDQADDLADDDLAADPDVRRRVRRRRPCSRGRSAARRPRGGRLDSGLAGARGTPGGRLRSGGDRRLRRAPLATGRPSAPALRRTSVVAPDPISSSDSPERSSTPSSRSMSAISSAASSAGAAPADSRRSASRPSRWAAGSGIVSSTTQASQRRKTSAAFWPPKPKALTSATRTER